MPIQSELLLHSKSSIDGRELVTFKIEVPLAAWIDLLTHRQWTRNASSSRAIPLKKWRERALAHPAVPTILTSYSKGMAANTPLDVETDKKVRELWNVALQTCADIHKELEQLNVSKQDANVLLYQFSHIQAIVSSTCWSNFFNLRCDEQAKPDVRLVAELMKDQLNNSTPVILSPGQWHTPLIFIDEANLSLKDKIKVSTARCARVSYVLPENQKVSDIKRDTDLHNLLLSSGHLSPFEHVATPFPEPNIISGNFIGWMQYRKLIEQDSLQEFPVDYKYLSTHETKKMAEQYNINPF